MKDPVSKGRKGKKPLRVDLITMIVLILLIAVAKPVLVIPACIIAILGIYFQNMIVDHHRDNISNMVERIVVDIAGITSSVLAKSPFPMCLVSDNGRILWKNDKFKALFSGQEYDDADDIYDLTGVKLHKLTNEELRDKVIQVLALNKFFRVQFSESELNELSETELKRLCDFGVVDNGTVTKVRMLHWMDLTANENLKKNYRDERLCIAHITVDNLDDILAQTDDEKKSSLAGDIEKELRQWAVRFQGALVRSSKSRFTFFCDSRNLENITANKFQILDEVRNMRTGVDIPASLSIGIGSGGKTIANTDEYALAALDLALGRGGDQAVLKRGSSVEYFGGKLQTVEKRNKGKSRIVALALRRLIDQVPHVYVMGHKLPDMDSLGAALGIARMAINRGKPVSIVIDSWDAVKMLHDLSLEEHPDIYISSETAKQSITREDLLVVVDTSKPSVAECGQLTTMADRVVVIDHHRRAEEMIHNPTLVHIEPYASSTSELVAEMLQYTANDKKGLSRTEAEGLLSGIAVDTKNFSVKTGVRTFEAAAWLRRQGADTTIVRQFFQTDMELFQRKAKIISSARRLRHDIAISHCEGSQKNISVLISMAADELLNIRGMRASFVAGLNDDGSVRVSARSLGEINVQLIMEKIGGGGNLTTAGARIEGMTIKDAILHLERIIMISLDEQAEKERKLHEKQQLKAEAGSTPAGKGGK